MSLSSLQLEAFHCLARTQHFTRASERLGITQSALSQRVSHLESGLGTALFIRERAGVRLTQAGLELLRYCQIKEGLESEFLSKLKSGKSQNLAGMLRIGGFSSITHSVLTPALSKLLRKHPAVRLTCQTRELYELPACLQRGEVDFVALDRIWEREGIAYVKLGDERNVLIESKSYQGAEIYLDHDEEDETTERYFKSQGKKWSAQRHFLGDIYGVIEGVRHGLGRAVVAHHLIANDSAIRILSPEYSLKTPVHLHYYEQPYYSKLHQSALKELIAQGRAKLGSD